MRRAKLGDSNLVGEKFLPNKLHGGRDLFRMLGASNSKKWFKEYPTAMRTLIMGGDADPVGAYGKASRYVYKQLLVTGCEDVKLLTYDGARHELFNETCRDEVFADILAWLNGGKI